MKLLVKETTFTISGVGKEVGGFEGREEEGTAVGEVVSSLGLPVGADDGTFVGLAVGTALGLAVGGAVGLAVGKADGTPVGEPEGADVGRCVGIGVGAGVGAAHRPEPSSHVRLSQSKSIKQPFPVPH